MISYQIETNVSPEEFADVLNRSTLGERRPVNDLARIGKMLRNANLVVTARDTGKLVGIARSITDFAYCTYLSDLAVDEAYQRQGIGKRLIRETFLAVQETKLILLSAPKAVGYYPKIGMTPFAHCFLLTDVAGLG